MSYRHLSSEQVEYLNEATRGIFSTDVMNQRLVDGFNARFGTQLSLRLLVSFYRNAPGRARSWAEMAEDDE